MAITRRFGRLTCGFIMLLWFLFTILHNHLDPLTRPNSGSSSPGDRPAGAGTPPRASPTRAPVLLDGLFPMLWPDDTRPQTESQWYPTPNFEVPPCENLPHLGRRCCFGGLPGGEWRPKLCNSTRYDLRWATLRGQKPVYLTALYDLLPEHSTIAIVGDSVSNQIFDLALCNLVAGGAVISSTTSEYRQIKDWWQYGVGWISSYQVSYRQKLLTWKYFHIYRFLNSSELDEMCSSTVTVLNFGVHYNTEIEYREMLYGETLPENKAKVSKDFRERMGVCAEKSVLLWRQTSAQHFSTSTGRYTKEAWLRKKCTWSENLGNQTWRENMMKTGLAKYVEIVDVDESVREVELSHRPRMYFLKFFDVVANRSDAHTTSGDCTHICTYFQIVEPLWKMIEIAVSDAVPEEARH